jgi:DNA mismatch repair protein MSH6
MSRMGAHDDIITGSSTFKVEMEEVAQILHNTTLRTHVLLDEVGHGTSTHNGYAVAHAVLEHMARPGYSLTIFSTHYQLLLDQFAQNDVISLMHMASHLDLLTSKVSISLFYVVD